MATRDIVPQVYIHPDQQKEHTICNINITSIAVCCRRMSDVGVTVRLKD